MRDSHRTVRSKCSARTRRCSRCRFHKDQLVVRSLSREIANQFPIKSVPDKNQGLINAVNAFIGSLERRMEMNFRRDWRFVWAINSGEIFQFPASRFGVESL